MAALAIVYPGALISRTPLIRAGELRRSPVFIAADDVSPTCKMRLVHAKEADRTKKENIRYRYTVNATIFN